jgi:two-component system, NtrC family, sensor kinase
MRIYRSITFKIIAIIFVSLILVTIGTTYVHDTVLARYLENTIQLCAERTSTFSKLALHNGMQENHREDIRRTILEIGNAPAISSIRVYDKTGRISFSANREDVGQEVSLQSQACYMCHETETPVRSDTDNYMRIYRSEDGHRVLGLITPIRNQRSCWDAPCHAHEEEQTVLGVLDVQLSLLEIDEQVAQGRTFMFFSAFLTFLLLAGVTTAFIFRLVHHPVKEVISGTKSLAAGDLDHHVPIHREDELGELATAFNSMASELKHTKAELVNWSNTLEEKVEQKTAELNTVQSQILHMEKMASLGKLSSMIAHELNNPLAGILTYARLTHKRLDAGDFSNAKLTAMRNDLLLIADEATRCGDIVKNLLFFARGHSTQYKQADFNDIIHKSVRLVQHNLDLYDIALRTHVPETPLIAVCDQNQMQQAVLALILNAIEAMPEGGTLSIALDTLDDDVLVRITDTGIGISESDQQRIFEPFFTTKENGHGTGLGLSIVYGIVRAHGGVITVDSAPGKGASFTIRIPMDSSHNQDQQTV